MPACEKNGSPHSSAPIHDSDSGRVRIYGIHDKAHRPALVTLACRNKEHPEADGFAVSPVGQPR